MEPRIDFNPSVTSEMKIHLNQLLEEKPTRCIKNNTKNYFSKIKQTLTTISNNMESPKKTPPSTNEGAATANPLHCVSGKNRPEMLSGQALQKSADIRSHGLPDIPGTSASPMTARINHKKKAPLLSMPAHSILVKKHKPSHSNIKKNCIDCALRGNLHIDKVSMAFKVSVRQIEAWLKEDAIMKSRKADNDLLAARFHQKVMAANPSRFTARQVKDVPIAVPPATGGNIRSEGNNNLVERPALQNQPAAEVMAPAQPLWRPW